MSPLTEHHFVYCKPSTSTDAKRKCVGRQLFHPTLSDEATMEHDTIAVVVNQQLNETDYLAEEKATCSIEEKGIVEKQKGKKSVRAPKVSVGQQVPVHSKLDRRHFCVYCKKLIVKLPRHLVQVHSSEIEIIEMCKFEPGMFFTS